MYKGNCTNCNGRQLELCRGCHHCLSCCVCGAAEFDADELGLDPETDNTPNTESRHA